MSKYEPYRLLPEYQKVPTGTNKTDATNNGPWERGKNQRVTTGTHKTAPVAPDVAQANSLSAQSNFYRGSKSNNNKFSNRNTSNRQTVKNPGEINLQSYPCPGSNALSWTNNGVALPGYDSLERGSEGGKSIRRKSKRITRSRKNKKRRHTRRNNSKRK